MADIEAYLRRDALQRLRHEFEAYQLRLVTCVTGARGEVDVLARPRMNELQALTIAFEMKNVACATDGVLSTWVKQASDYVGARPDNGWPPIAAVFLWLVGIAEERQEPDKSRVRGILQLAAQFRVGTAVLERGDDWALMIMPHRLFRSGKAGWSQRAQEYLLAKRQAAGVRRRLYVGPRGDP